MMTVQIGERAYEMEAERAEALLRLASELVSCGIYAVRKKGYLELKNAPMSRTKLREARRHYRKLRTKGGGAVHP